MQTPYRCSLQPCHLMSNLFFTRWRGGQNNQPTFDEPNSIQVGDATVAENMEFLTKTLSRWIRDPGFEDLPKKSEFPQGHPIDGLKSYITWAVLEG